MNSRTPTTPSQVLTNFDYAETGALDWNEYVPAAAQSLLPPWVAAAAPEAARWLQQCRGRARRRRCGPRRDEQRWRARAAPAALERERRDQRGWQRGHRRSDR